MGGEKGEIDRVRESLQVELAAGFVVCFLTPSLFLPAYFLPRIIAEGAIALHAELVLVALAPSTKMVPAHTGGKECSST